jgi:hypothetical protein
MNLSRSAVLLSLAVLSSAPAASSAADTSALPISIATGWDEQVLCADGARGAFVVWRGSYTVEAQHLDALGTLDWGQALQLGMGAYPQVAPDGEGGVYIAWDRGDYPNTAIYAQHLGADGRFLIWPRSSVVASGFFENHSVAITPDGAGGAIFAVSDGYVRVQRLDRYGNALWGEDGVRLGAIAGAYRTPHLAPDGAGGALVAFTEPGDVGVDMVAQRLSASGERLWGEGGLVLAKGAERGAFAWISGIAANGSGGGVISWVGPQSSHLGLYAQKVTAGGAAVWASGGVLVGSTASYGTLISDGGGGAILAWLDEHDYPTGHLKMQRLDANAATLWGADGIELAAGPTRWPDLIPDNAGGAIVAWTDGARDELAEVYAQRLDPTGAPAWGAHGRKVSHLSGRQYLPRLASDGDDGAIAVWQDYVDGTPERPEYARVDLYGARISGPTGLEPTVMGPSQATLELRAPSPNPARVSTAVSFDVHGDGPVTIAVYDAAGHRVRTLADETMEQGPHELRFDLRDSAGRRLPAGLYFVGGRAGGAQVSRRFVVL